MVPDEKVVTMERFNCHMYDVLQWFATNLQNHMGWKGY
jgi:hypothetical protein